MTQIFDAENQLSVAQAFTGGATVSTNSYQKQTAAQDISIGRRMAILVFFRAAGAGTTHTLQAIQATSAALDAGVDVLSEVVIPTSAVKLGEAVEVPIPQGVMNKQFLGFRHSAASGTTTATIDAYLVPQDQIHKYKSFPKVPNFPT
jgi:hypothetical protein